MTSKTANVLFVSALECPFAMRTWIALLEKGVIHKRVDINLQDKPAWLPNVNPLAKVPVLLVSDSEIARPENFQGKTVYESLICNEFLEDQFPKPALLPASAIERAHIRLLVDHFGNKALPEIFKILGRQNHQERQDAVVALKREFKSLDQRLEDKAFLFGDQFTLADAAIYPFFAQFSILNHHRPEYVTWWPVEFPNLRRWVDAVSQRPSLVTIIKEVTEKTGKDYDSFLAGVTAKFANPPQPAAAAAPTTTTATK